MDLLFSSAAFFARPLEQTFRLVADTGYAGIEVMVTKDLASQDAGTMASLAGRHGLRIGAIHSPCLLLTRKVWGTDPVGKTLASIDLAEKVGAPVVVVHPPFRWQRGYRHWLTHSLPGQPGPGGVTVCVENMFPVRLGARGMRLHSNHHLLELDEMPCLALDTSHAAVAGHDPTELRRRFGGRVRHVHLSDNAGRGWDSHLPPGEGVLDLDGFLDDLVRDDYSGAVTLEIDLRRYLTDDAKLRRVMVDMRERCEARLVPAPPD